MGGNFGGGRKNITLAAVWGICYTEGARRTRGAGRPVMKEKNDWNKD